MALDAARKSIKWEPLICSHSGNPVILNIKGNDYRFEATVSYRTAIVVVGWIGAEYDARNRRR